MAVTPAQDNIVLVRYHPGSPTVCADTTFLDWFWPGYGAGLQGTVVDAPVNQHLEPIMGNTEEAGVFT